MEIKQLKVSTTSASFQPRVDRDQINDVLKNCSYLTNTFATITNVNNELDNIRATINTKQDKLTPVSNGGITVNGSNIDALDAIEQSKSYTNTAISTEREARENADTELDDKITAEQNRALEKEATLLSQYTNLSSTKQDKIADLETIRSNAAKGASASDSLTNYATKQDLSTSASSTETKCKNYTDELRNNPKYTMTINSATGILTIKENY